MQVLSSVLYELYEAAEYLPIHEYQETAMQAIGRLIRFDGGMLGIGCLHDLSPELAYVYRRASSLVPELARIWSQDPLIRHWQCGAATPIACDCERRCRDARLVRQDYFYRRYHIARLLLIGDGGGRDGMWIALFRSAGAPFRSEECRHLADLWPHAVLGMMNNRRRNLERQLADHEGRAAALMSREGVIEAEDPAFRLALRDEWPQFSGRRMPTAVLHCWYAGTAYVGERICISMSAQREYVLCQAKRWDMHHVLTRAERVVALQFASGLNHREIAQKLGVSQNTVRSHIAHAYEKLDVHDKAALANTLAAEPELAGARRNS